MKKLIDCSENLEQKHTGTAVMPSDRKAKQHKNKMQMIIWAASMVLLLILSAFLFRSAASKAFQTTQEKTADKVHNDFYHYSYTVAEKAHHVSNRVSISIDTLCEEARLEVLQVSDITYVIGSKKGKTPFSGDVTCWLEVPGKAVYTVNLKAAEFIIDEQRQTVLVRLPSPELSEFSVDYVNVLELYAEDTGLLKNPAKVGEVLAREMIQDGAAKLRSYIDNNQHFCISAKASAEQILTSLVKELNPSVPNLTVEIEWLD